MRLGFSRQRHIRALGQHAAASIGQRAGIVQRDLILGGAGQGDIGGDPPGLGAFAECHAQIGGWRCRLIAACVQQPVERVMREPVLGHPCARASGQRDHTRPFGHRLARGVARDIAPAGNGDALAVQRLSPISSSIAAVK